MIPAGPFSSSRLRPVWILLAAGRSSRFGGARSKLLEPIDGRRLIDVTIESLYRALPGAPVVLVSTPDFRDEIGHSGPWTEGGARRQDSAARGVAAAGEADVAMIHDAARPFVTPELVRRLIAGLESSHGVAPALPVTDTVKRVKDGEVLETLDRSELVALQTPQAVRFDAMKAAFAAMPADREFTDDLAVLEAAGGKTAVVEGDRRNIKITTPEDLRRAAEILRRWYRA